MRVFALLTGACLAAAFPLATSAMDSTPTGHTAFPPAVPGPDDVVRQALADLETLDRCLQTGESESRDRADGVALQRLRTLYVLSVEDADRLEPARSVRDELTRSQWGRRTGGDLLEAYSGALEMLDAKHGFWPNARLRHMRVGLERLDRAVGANPRDVEVRYLRLVSTAFLPGILRRNESVREDLAVLTRLLPDAVEDFPMRTYDAMASTLLELLPTDHPDRPSVEGALERALSESRPLAPGCRGS